jgi:alpha-L-fucosidase
MELRVALFVIGALMASAVGAALPSPAAGRAPIRAFCIDFNWGDGGVGGFARPGLWADASPSEHVAWYKALGCNTIQTFAVSCNGYAWYKGGRIPAQPGLVHDFLPEIVRLGHKRGMRVMGYFCAGANTRWSQEHPDLSYGAQGDQCIPFTDAYLAYLGQAVEEGLRLGKMDGFMVDWLFCPSDGARQRATAGKWLPCERELFEKLMSKPFAGEASLTAADRAAYEGRAVERCWRVIHDTAKRVKPDCTIWLSCHNPRTSGLVGNSVLKEVDWFMEEGGRPGELQAIAPRFGPQTRPLLCLVGWGDGHDAAKALSDPVNRAYGIYGFARPDGSSLPRPVALYRSKPSTAFSGNDRNIAVLARWFNGRPLDEVRPLRAPLAKPSAAQYAWHEQERLLFVCLGVATWLGTEYDTDGKFDLTKMNPSHFDADGICRAAKAWGAKEVLLVASHVGGFCWWPTTTTEYCVRNIPWRGGKGNLVKEVADACRKHALSIGIYLYPDDVRFTKSIGAGGKTDDPARQAEWNRLFRTQWEEVLGFCGPDLVREVWLDGGSIIDLSDILKRLAPNAVVFQGRNASIRWVGNEAGISRDPNWNSLRRADLASGGATQDQGDPDGDAWAPVECDTPLYDHNWFWNAGNEQKRKSLDRLMDLYVQSAGRGSVLLLNATPNTTGRIPEGDMARYTEFGHAIERNFGHPVASVKSVSGRTATLDLGGPEQVNCVDLWEEYGEGHRIRAYTVEGRVGGAWQKLASGTAVGRRKIDLFAPVTVDRIRVRITEAVGTPTLRLLQAHRVDDRLAHAHQTPLSQGCAATASTSHSAPYEPGYLVDGDTGSRWGSVDGDRDPWVVIDLGRPRKFARARIMELADRVQAFTIETRSAPDQPWRTLHTGSTIGAAWQADFERVTGRYVRLHILKYTGPGPTLWEFQLYDHPEAWEMAGQWRGAEATVDLSAVVTEAGQYDVRFVTADGVPVPIVEAKAILEGRPAASGVVTGIGTDTVTLNRTQAIGPGASTAIQARLKVDAGAQVMAKVRARG